MLLATFNKKSEKESHYTQFNWPLPYIDLLYHGIVAQKNQRTSRECPLWPVQIQKVLLK